MAIPTSAYPPHFATKSRVFFGARHLRAQCPPTCQLCGPDPPEYKEYKQLDIAHAKAGSMKPSKDVTEQWECKTNLQALGICADGPVWVVRGEAIRAW